MKILITMDIDHEFADEGHPMGVTEQGYNLINDALAPIGTDIEVARAEP